MKLLVSMAALLALPLLAHPQGTIIYHNPPDIRVFSDGATPSTYDLDLDDNGSVDYAFRAVDYFQLRPSGSNQTMGTRFSGELTSTLRSTPMGRRLPAARIC